MSSTNATMTEERARPDADDFTTRGTMLEALLTSKVGEGTETTKVAPETLGMLQLLQGTLLTPKNMDLMLVSKEKLFVALVRQFVGLGLVEHASRLVDGVTSEEGLAALPWKAIMTQYTHEEVPDQWHLHSDGCEDKNGATRLESNREERKRK